MASITKVRSIATERKGADGYRVQWRDPEARQRARTFRTLADARRFKTRIEGELLAGSYVDPAEGRQTFANYVATYLATPGRQPGTIEMYEAHLRNHLLPALGSRPLAQIRPTELQGVFTALADRLAPSTVQTVRKIVGGVFNAAVRDRLIAESPCRGIKLPEVRRTEIRAMTPEQVAALASAIDPRFTALIRTGVGTGLRPGELFGMRLTNVDFLRGEIHVREQVQVRKGFGPVFTQPKTASSVRTVPMPSYVVAVLARHLEEYPTGDVIFTLPGGGLIPRNRFNDSFWRPAHIAAELPDTITPHSLRHTYVAGLIHAGRHPAEIQRRCGHKSITETMDTYGHLFPDDAEAANSALDALFGADLAPRAHVDEQLTSAAGRVVPIR